MIIIENEKNEKREPFGSEIEKQYWNMLFEEIYPICNNENDLDRLTNIDHIDTTKYIFNRRCLYGLNIMPKDKDIEYLKALYKAVIIERCKNIKYACYRYVEAYTNRVEYVGIVNEGDLCRRHYGQHINEEWYKRGEYYFQFFQMRNRSETEMMESHLIALYETYKYGNKSKSGWGINSFVPPLHDYMWITADSNAYCAYNNYLDYDLYYLYNPDLSEENKNDIGFPVEYYDDPLCFWDFYNNYNKHHGVECNLEDRKTEEVKRRTENALTSLDSFYSKYLHSKKSNRDCEQELFTLIYNKIKEVGKYKLTDNDFDSIIREVKEYLKSQNNDNKYSNKQIKILDTLY